MAFQAVQRAVELPPEPEVGVGLPGRHQGPGQGHEMGVVGTGRPHGEGSHRVSGGIGRDDGNAERQRVRGARPPVGEQPPQAAALALQARPAAVGREIVSGNGGSGVVAASKAAMPRRVGRPRVDTLGQRRRLTRRRRRCRNPATERQTQSAATAQAARATAPDARRWGIPDMIPLKVPQKLESKGSGLQGRASAISLVQCP